MNIERNTLIESIRRNITHPGLRRFLLEQLEVRQTRLTQKQIDEIVSFRILNLADIEQQILRSYVEFFKQRTLDQVECDSFVRSLEESLVNRSPEKIS